MNKVIQNQMLDFIDNRMNELAEEVYEGQIIDIIDVIESYTDKGPVRKLAIQAVKDIDLDELANSKELKENLDGLYNLIGIR